MTKDEPDRAAREPSTGGKRLVLVVHGLGDDSPGEKVQAVGRALAIARGRSRAPTQEVLWLPQGSDRQIDECEFPCHIERLRDDGTETVLAEVYWADHSGMGHGILAVVLGIFRLIFGLHQVIARHAPDPTRSDGRPREPAAVVLRWLSMGTAYLLRAPAVAMMVSWGLFAAIVAIWGLTSGIWDPTADGPSLGEHQGGMVQVLSMTANLIGLAVGIAGFWWRRGRPHRALFLWLAVFSMIWVIIGLVRWRYPSLVSGFWSEEVGLGQAWASSASGSINFPSLPYLLIVLAAVAWLIARLRAEPGHRPGLDVAQAVNYLVLVVWVLLVQFFLLLAKATLAPGAMPPEAEPFLGRVANTMASYGVLMLIPLGAALVILVLRERWKKGTRASSYRPGRPVPRLVLGNGILFPLICLPLVSPLFVFVPGVAKLLQESTVSKIVFLAVPVVAFVAGSASEGLRFGVDFALDFVSHFERRRAGADGRPAFVRRELIRQRLRIVMKTLIRQERPDRVTVLAHSQGTVVAAETLAEDGAEALLEPLARCDLVTMGSPFHHLYQHYFPNEYPALSHQRWDGLRQRIDRWINIFRIDDYIGTDIEPGGEWPENLPVDAGGHSGYWSDRQVLRILDDRQLV